MKEYLKIDILSTKKEEEGSKIGEGSLKLKQLNRLFLMYNFF